MHRAAAVILCGGQSARFGSDKALAGFRGEPLLARSLRAALGAFERVAVAAKDPLRYAAVAPAGVDLLSDDSAQETPLAGLVAGLRWTPLETVFAFAVDMPFAIDLPLLDALFANLGHHLAAVPQHKGFPEALCGLWRKAALGAGEPLLRAGKGPSALLRAIDSVLVPWADERPFLDADTPEDLARLATL